MSNSVAATPIDLTTLGSTFGVIPVAPAYPRVKEAIERLQAAERENRSYIDRDKDVRLVHEFAELVKTNLEPIARAIITGALVGRAKESQSREEEISIGLEILRKRYPAILVGSEGRLLQIAFLQWIREIWGASKSLPKLSSALGRPDWPLSQLDGLLGDVLTEIRAAVKFTPEIRDRVASQAIISICKRIERYVSLGEGVTRPTPEFFAELFFSVEDSDPAPYADFSSATVGDWMRILDLAFDRGNLSSSVPAVDLIRASMLAAVALGFRISDESIWRRVYSPSEGVDADLHASVVEISASLPQTRRVNQPRELSTIAPERVLVLVTPPDSTLKTLLPEPDFVACLVQPSPSALPRRSEPITPAAAFLQALEGERELVLAIEVRAEPNGAMPDPTSLVKKADEVASSLRFGKQRPHKRVFVYTSSYMTPQLSPAVLAPKTLRDIMTGATRRNDGPPITDTGPR